MQKEELDPKFQIFSDVTSLQERMDGETEGSSFPFIPLCKRIAWQLGVSSLKVIRFLMDNPEILMLPAFASLIPSVSAGDYCMVECIDKCNKLYGDQYASGLFRKESILHACLAACGQGCGCEKGYSRKEL
jgi:hypothetical protein